MDLSRGVVDCLYLCSHSDWHRDYTVSEFQRYFLYPLIHNKIMIYHEDQKPVGLVTWCFLPEDIGTEFLDGLYDLDQEDYLAEDGEEMWAVEFIAPFGHARHVMRHIRETSKQRYGPKRIVNWRRLARPDIRHKGVL
jgi:cytolysin-activating lysine-acyltransferase